MLLWFEHSTSSGCFYTILFVKLLFEYDFLLSSFLQPSSVTYMTLNCLLYLKTPCWIMLTYLLQLYNKIRSLISYVLVLIRILSFFAVCMLNMIVFQNGFYHYFTYWWFCQQPMSFLMSLLSSQGSLSYCYIVSRMTTIERYTLYSSKAWTSC